jgi:hypothetical protein
MPEHSSSNPVLCGLMSRPEFMLTSASPQFGRAEKSITSFCQLPTVTSERRVRVPDIPIRQI